jgi:predicted ATPase
MRPDCECSRLVHAPRRVALTGGPGAGKTAVLGVIQRSLCRHVHCLPEAASILFVGGFPRHDTPPGHAGAQRAIYRVQAELERITVEEQQAAIVLCDRGTIDGLAYWPGPPESFWSEVGTTYDAELARYAAVIHLRTPAALRGYDHSNPVRRETPAEAAAIDDRILAAWSAHPNRTVIEATEDFVHKIERTLEAVRRELPACCRVNG